MYNTKEIKQETGFNGRKLMSFNIFHKLSPKIVYYRKLDCIVKYFYQFD